MKGRGLALPEVFRAPVKKLMNQEITDKTRIGLPMLALISIVISLVTGTGSALAAYYGLRDEILGKTEAQINANAGLLRAERREELRHYLSREAFSQWREAERIRQDAQFYSLLNAIEKLRSSLETRRR